MGFVAADLCTVSQLRLDQSIRNLTCGDLEIPVVVIRLGVNDLRKTTLVYLLYLFEERVEDRFGQNWDKTVLHCFEKVKYQQSYTPGI